MYIYEYGAIGETIRTKIDSYKQRVRGCEGSSDSFGEVLKTYLHNTEKETKVVSATGNSTLSSQESTAANALSGSDILYAIQNSDSDATASAVLSALGFSSLSGGGSSSLKNAADSLSDSAQQLLTVNASGADKTMVVTEFVTDFNALVTRLGSESTSSAYMYKNALSAMLQGSAEALSQAGLSQENGYLSYEGGGSALSEVFLGNVVSTAELISSYASSVTEEGSEDYNGVSQYYTALMESMM